MPKKKILFCFAALGLSLAFVEACSAVGLLYLQKKGVVYTAPAMIKPAEYETYLRTRDPVLGWPSPGSFNNTASEFDSSGARKSPAFPDPDNNPAYLSVYGDSFTWGDTVDSVHAYPNIFAKRLGKRVSNFGVNGYGTDQAYLRFLNNTQDHAKVVILGYTTENILRNVNRYRDLLYPPQKTSQAFGFKPRFIISSDGELRLIPLPRYSYDEWIQLAMSPERIPLEYFIPGGNAGIYKAKFPYTATIIQALLNNFHIKAAIAKEPWYREFYESDHPSKALWITFNILKEFHTEALRRNARPIVLIIPTGSDCSYYAKHKKWAYQNLINLLNTSTLEFLDTGPLFLKKSEGQAAIPEIFNDIHGHFNEKGYAMLADILYRYLSESKQPIPRNQIELATRRQSLIAR